MDIIAPPTPRLRRLSEALIRDPVTRDEADGLIPVPNGPHFIGTLRRWLELLLVAFTMGGSI